jgi:TPR repeat protein
MLMGDAAGRGSKACFRLGLAYAAGIWGFPKDEKMARRYYLKVASAAIEVSTLLRLRQKGSSHMAA